MKSKGEDSATGTLPRSEARLDHVTKGRVKGPQGRRLPRKPQKSNGNDSKADSVLDLNDETAVRDSRGKAISLSALEASSETHLKPRLEFELGSEDDDHSNYLNNSPSSNQSPNTNRLSFEQAWFITLPDSRCKSGRKTEDEDNTSDYSSMHGSSSPPSSESSKRSPSASPTNPPEKNSIRTRIEKFLCSLL